MWDSAIMHEPWNRAVMSSSSSVVEEQEAEGKKLLPPPSFHSYAIRFFFILSITRKNKKTLPIYHLKLGDKPFPNRSK